MNQKKAAQSEAVFKAAGNIAYRMMGRMTGNGPKKVNHDMPITFKVDWSNEKMANVVQSCGPKFKNSKNDPKQNIVLAIFMELVDKEVDSSKEIEMYRDFEPIMQACGFLAYAAKTVYACLAHTEAKTPVKGMDITMKNVALCLDQKTSCLVPVYMPEEEKTLAHLKHCVNVLLNQKSKELEAAKEEASQEAPNQEASKEVHQEEASQKAPKQEASKEVHQDEASQEAPKQEASKEVHQDEASQEAPNQEASKEVHQDEALQEEPKQEASKEVHQDEASQEAPNQEASKEVHQDEATPKEPQLTKKAGKPLQPSEKEWMSNWLITQAKIKEVTRQLNEKKEETEQLNTQLAEFGKIIIRVKPMTVEKIKKRFGIPLN